MSGAVPFGALIPLFVAGAVGFAAVALALLVPRNREMRWFTAFNIALVIWLLLLTVAALGLEIPAADRLRTLTVEFLPGLFVATALVQLRPTRPSWQPTAAAATGLMVGLATVLPADWPASAAAAGLVATVWQVAGWLIGMVLVLSAEGRRKRIPAGPGRGGMRSLVIALTTVAPAVVVVGVLSGGPRFLELALPLVVLGTYIALLIGVARLRFYDVEVRVARSGEIAAATAETTRLAALGELAASFAHEVRNPLTGVRSLAQRLAEDDVAEDRRRRYAGVILEETGRIDRILEHMLRSGQRLPGFDASPESTELDALFDDLCLLASSRAQRASVRIEWAPCGLAPGVRRDALAQALLNLVLNGIAHSPRGGRVTLAGVGDPTGTTVSVCDEGPGVPPGERERIFEPFYSSRPDGAGLGLSVVRTIAREEDWTLEVDDAPGGGACFRLRIPVAPARPPTCAPLPMSPGASA